MENASNEIVTSCPYVQDRSLLYEAIVCVCVEYKVKLGKDTGILLHIGARITKVF